MHRPIAIGYTRIWAAIGLASSTFVGCGTRQVRLEVPHTTPSSSYTCNQLRCTGATSLVPADENRSGTAFITLPLQCRGRFHRIMIEDPSSTDPVVHATCAPAEPAHLETMGGAGAAGESSAPTPKPGALEEMH